MRAVIVGAGIGGLCAAVGLHRTGCSVTVLERAASPDPLGTCIALAPNALRALDAIGLGNRFRDFGVDSGRGGIRNSNGRWLSTMDPSAISAYFGEPFVVTRRGRLTEVLLEALPDSALHNGSRVTGVHGDTIETDAGTDTADLIVGADGVNSAVRGSLFPWYGGPKVSGLTGWRFVAHAPDLDYPGSETWGAGQLFGIVPLTDGEYYCFASAPNPPRGSDQRAELEQRFDSWHEPIPRLTEAADEILAHELYSLDPPPPTFHSGRTALLGDAAHAMLPNLGQGGCLAIEDAATLAALVRRHTELDSALAEYSRLRRPRAAAMVRGSARAARTGILRSPVLRAARDGVLRAVDRLPERLALRGMGSIVDWRPPR